MKPLVYRKSQRKRTQKRQAAQKMRITKGDRVKVIRGAFKGTEGTVLEVFPRKRQVVIEGVRIVSKHRRPTASDEGGIVKMPAPIDASNVMLLDPKSGEPTRIRRQKDKDGTVERISKRSGQPIPRTR
jgi:large subunit ribosomal protein L24